MPTHPPESLDWFNVLSAQITIAYRNLIINSTTGHGGPRGFMEEVLNRKDNVEEGGVDGEEPAEGLVAIDRIQVGEVELGEKFPIFSNARVRPSGSDGAVVSLALLLH